MVEFSRYLNQGIRNKESDIKLWELFITVAMTLLFTELCKLLVNTQLNVDGIPNAGVIFLILIIVIIVISPSAILTWKTIKPIWENSIDKYLLIDYKEIIDKILEDIK